MQVAKILARKGADVFTIEPDATVAVAVAVLGERHVGALIVSSDGTTVAGIVSERDVVRRLHSDGTVINNVVSTIMTSSVRTCSPTDDLDEILAVMTNGRFRHIPVCDGPDCVGIVSIGDLVKHKIDQLQFERDQLDQYVHQT